MMKINIANSLLFILPMAIFVQAMRDKPTQPILKMFKFGKYAGVPLNQIPVDYLVWVAEKYSQKPVREKALLELGRRVLDRFPSQSERVTSSRPVSMGDRRSINTTERGLMFVTSSERQGETIDSRPVVNIRRKDSYKPATGGSYGQQQFVGSVFAFELFPYPVSPKAKPVAFTNISAYPLEIYRQQLLDLLA